jgi:Family of unknown function (DUF6464)
MVGVILCLMILAFAISLPLLTGAIISSYTTIDIRKMFSAKLRKLLILAWGTFCTCCLIRNGFHLYLRLDFLGLIVNCINLILLFGSVGLISDFLPNVYIKAGRLTPIESPVLQFDRYILGDERCLNNARSEYLQCAINPYGDCKTCKDREPAKP